MSLSNDTCAGDSNHTNANREYLHYLVSSWLTIGSPLAIHTGAVPEDALFAVDGDNPECLVYRRWYQCNSE